MGVDWKSDELEKRVEVMRSLLNRMCDFKPGFAIGLMVAMIMTRVTPGRMGQQEEQNTKIPKGIGMLIPSRHHVL